MTPDELRTELARLGITYPDPNTTLRACLYLQELQAAERLFRTTMPRPVTMGGLGPGYALVHQALQDPGLLNTLSKALDDFIVEAVNADLRARGNPALAADFAAYYGQFILTDNYVADRTAFLDLYPVTRDLIAAIGRNFRNNIFEACTRIVADWNTIQAVFVNEPTGQLEALTRIGSSGSDFHKGGKQVLILSFDVRYLVSGFFRNSPAHKTLNIVYKPSDLEADCLLAGNSAAVNAVHNNFQAASLFEIMNTAIQTAKQNNPMLELETLPVYKILPMRYGSAYAVGTNLPNIRNAYGYIEYLEHFFLPGIRIPYFGYYPYGTSDFRIFPSQDQAAICSKFYRIIGQLTALASTFSLRDLHVENMIVQKYTPHLIDMEICLATLTTNVTETSLYGYMAAVTDETGASKKSYSEQGNQGGLFINKHLYADYEKNRLWTVEPWAIIDPAPYANHICRSLRDMMGVIQAAINTNPLNTWRDRLLNNGQGVVVRYIPLGTQDFLTLLASVADEMECNHPNALAGFVSAKRGDLYNTWFAQQALDPKFLALQDANVLADFLNADVPIFYHRIGTLDIVDSRGNAVLVPANITYIPGIGQQPIQVNINLGRNTYFAQSPFMNRIFNTQLNAISTNAGRDLRVAALVSQVLGDLHLANAANDVAAILA